MRMNGNQLRRAGNKKFFYKCLCVFRPIVKKRVRYAQSGQRFGIEGKEFPQRDLCFSVMVRKQSCRPLYNETADMIEIPPTVDFRPLVDAAGRRRRPICRNVFWTDMDHVDSSVDGASAYLCFCISFFVRLYSDKEK